MKNKLIPMLICIALVSCLSLPAFATDVHPMVVDEADLLSASEETALEETIQILRDTYQIDIVILTVNQLHGKSPQDYADDYYDQNGYGYDEEGSGLLYLLSMEERQWYISTCGKAIYALTDYGIQVLGESILPFLSEGDYASAFDTLLDYLPAFLDAYEKQQPIDGDADLSGDYYHGEQESVVYHQERSSASILLVSLVIGILTGGAAVLGMVFSMNTKRKQQGATGYVTPGSYRITRHQDLFLYSDISKVRRQQNSSGSGGGSSVHRSSSGRSHGGGGGHF